MQGDGYPIRDSTVGQCSTFWYFQCKEMVIILYTRLWWSVEIPRLLRYCWRSFADCKIKERWTCCYCFADLQVSMCSADGFSDVNSASVISFLIGSAIHFVIESVRLGARKEGPESLDQILRAPSHAPLIGSGARLNSVLLRLCLTRLT